MNSEQKLEPSGGVCFYTCTFVAGSHSFYDCTGMCSSKAFFLV